MANTTAITPQDLEARFGGALIRAEDADYDDARKLFNAMIDKRPEVIARCAGTEDVVSAIDYARESGLEVAIRCGGHSGTGLSSCDDGILIDLAGLDDVEVDPEARIARAGGGVLWGAFDVATQAHGLHTPGGRVTTTGIGGFTTGGGYGWTSSKHGLTCDNLVSAEVVTADGRVLNASEEENPELFWGIRGGGGNFGVVTRFDFRLHELGPEVLAGLALWPLERAPEVVRGWRDHVEDAPDELSTGIAVMTAPPEEFVPEHLRGRPAVGIPAIYAGDPGEGAPVMQPLKDLGPDLDLIGPMPYVEFQALLDPANPPGLRNYFRGDYLAGLPDEAIDLYLERSAEIIGSAPLSGLIIFPMGAGGLRAGEGSTAFPHRDAGYLFHPILQWDDPAQDREQIASGRDFGRAMEAFGTGASYLNFTPDRDRVRAAYGDEKLARLVALKDEFDPDNLFRGNHNVAPSGRTEGMGVS
jgi:FAD/FMN-containing dehydrogenase